MHEMRCHCDYYNENAETLKQTRLINIENTMRMRIIIAKKAVILARTGKLIISGSISEL